MWTTPHKWIGSVHTKFRPKIPVGVMLAVATDDNSFLWGVVERRVVVTNVLGKPIASPYPWTDWTQDETDRLSRNVGNYRYTLRNIAEERGSHFHIG